MTQIQHSYRRTWTGKGIPTVDNCDPLNPRQAFLPFLVGLQVGAPILPGVEFLEATSEHLVECLGIPVANGRLLEPIGKSLGWERRRKYIPPMTVLDPKRAAGVWVTMDEPDPEAKSVAMIFAELPHAERVALGEEVLKARGLQFEGAIPQLVTVKDLATQIRMSAKATVELLEGWGVKAKVGGTVDWPTARRVMQHVARTQK